MPFEPEHRREPDSPVKERAIAALREVFDPEIPINIFDLGLIYRLDISPEGHAEIVMTLTSPNCPVAGTLPGDAEKAVAGVDGVTGTHLELVWDPPFTMEMLSEAARLQLNL
jgi:FeS assembly SUF system protein